MTQTVALALHREGLLFFDPQSSTWQTREAYLSGNIRHKLHMAQLEYTSGVSDLDPDILSSLEGNIAALQQV